MRLAVILGHEAYRDGIIKTDNHLETRITTLAHTEMLVRMLNDGQNVAMNENFLKDLAAYSFGNSDFFNFYVDNNYDSSGDFWKLTREGNLEYDGFATLRDADGNIIVSYRDMDGLRSDDFIESALLWLLNVNRDDTAQVLAVRNMMAGSGLLHSYDDDPENWIWKGEHTALTENSSFPTVEKIDLTQANMGRTINMRSISGFFNSTGASGEQIITSVNRTYNSAIDFLNYADAGGSASIARSMLSKHYDLYQMAIIQINQTWLHFAEKNGVNINDMVQGNPNRTAKFDVYSGDLKLSSSSVQGASYFSEQHSGIDYGGGGTAILTPGGFWTLIKTDEHKAYYQLYGGDLRMRIQHVNPDELKTISLNTIFGGNNSKLLNYPTKSYGTGTGAHIHIDMTRNLPYNGRYVRQFVDPETLLPGNQLEYQYAYKDANQENLFGYPRNFNRF